MKKEIKILADLNKFVTCFLLIFNSSFCSFKDTVVMIYFRNEGELDLHTHR